MSGPIFWLHLQTRCGCARRINYGATPPPREYVLVLSRSRRAPTPVLTLAAENTPGVRAAVVDMLADNGVRVFELVSFSGDREHGGTGLYEEV